MLGRDETITLAADRRKARTARRACSFRAADTIQLTSGTNTVIGGVGDRKSAAKGKRGDIGGSSINEKKNGEKLPQLIAIIMAAQTVNPKQP